MELDQITDVSVASDACIPGKGDENFFSGEIEVRVGISVDISRKMPA
jgi:hypothetical protein